MHAIRHQYRLEDVREIARALDEAGIAAIEVTHGDGLAGLVVQLRLRRATPTSNISKRSPAPCERGRSRCCCCPGIGTVQDLEAAYDAGARSVRVATHCTEADVAKQHIETAREIGMDVAGLLMLAHMTAPKGSPSRRS